MAGALAWKRFGTKARRVAGLLAIGIIVEALIAYPNYIAHFNFALGGPRGGIELLGDSNLDWGQDLPAYSTRGSRRGSEGRDRSR